MLTISLSVLLLRPAAPGASFVECDPISRSRKRWNLIAEGAHRRSRACSSDEEKARESGTGEPVEYDS